MIELREIQFGVTEDKEFAEYLVEMMKIFTYLKMDIIYNFYFHKYYLHGTLPVEINSDYVVGLIDGIMMEHERMTKIQGE
jgi:hypothetical protein